MSEPSVFKFASAVVWVLLSGSQNHLAPPAGPGINKVRNVSGRDP